MFSSAPLQFVRKISGFTKPSQANTEAFNRAVQDITSSARELIASLSTSSAPRDRGRWLLEPKPGLQSDLRDSNLVSVPD